MAKETTKTAPKPDLVSEIREIAEKHGAKVGVTNRADGSKIITVVK